MAPSVLLVLSNTLRVEGWMELSNLQVITKVTVERKIIDLRKMSVQIYKFNKEKHGLKVCTSKMT
jgi:hypothetical protein